MPGLRTASTPATRASPRLACLLLATAAAALAGCATQEKDPNRVSTIPWNRPEGWEGAGGFGGFNPENMNRRR